MEPIEKTINDTISNFKKDKVQMIKKIQEEFQLQISEDLIEEMIMNISLRKFISEIEICVSKFLNSRNLKSKNKIYFKKDWEVYEFIKIILLLNFKDISFEEECKLWGEIIKLLEDKIDNTIKSNSGNMKKELFGLKRRLYILLDFD